MLPRVILHNGVSLDGRVDGYQGGIGQFYQVASAFQADAMLAGSDTLLAAYESAPPDDEHAAEALSAEPAAAPDPGDTRALLVVPDSRGRIHNWPQIRREPWWRDVVVLCSHATPADYVDQLRQMGIDHIVAGDDHVDLRAALEELNTRHGIRTVQVDSGGTLNGVLLRAGLVDEISLLISPTLAGGLSPRSIYRAPDLASPEGIIPLRLFHLERLEDGIVWLRYEVVR
ncbi:MAG: RibD family protein [Anaerolineae bacterium]|nr:RibD family protein [Anaerolineae bacterium]